jgi:hypothetical protein
VGQAIRTGWRWQLPAWVAGLALWGFPGTPGFLARTVLILPTDLAVAAPLFVIILVAETLLAAALWQAAASAGTGVQAAGGASAQPPFGTTDENVTAPLGPVSDRARPGLERGGSVGDWPQQVEGAIFRTDAHAAGGATAHENVMLSGLTNHGSQRRESSEASRVARDSSLGSRRNAPHGDNPLRVTDRGIFRAVVSTPAGENIIRLSLALGLLAAPVIAWGLMPVQLAGLAGLPAGQAFPTLPWLLLHMRRSVWTGLLLSGIAGAGLGLLREQIFAQMRGWQQGITVVVSLEWLYRGMAAGLALVGSGLQYFATLGEGEGYLGWLALAALILWVLLRG